MVDLVFDNLDANQTESLPNEIQGFVSIRMSSRSLSFWFMVPYQIKLSLSSELKLPTYIDLGTFNSQYAPMGLYNKAFPMASNGTLPVTLHDIYVSVDPDIFEVALKVNQKYIVGGHRVVIDANIRKQSLGNVQLRLRRGYNATKVRTHFRDEQ